MGSDPLDIDAIRRDLVGIVYRQDDEVVYDAPSGTIVGRFPDAEPDAHWFAKSPDVVRSLCDEVDRLRAKNERLRDDLRKYDEDDDDDGE